MTGLKYYNLFVIQVFCLTCFGQDKIDLSKTTRQLNNINVSISLQHSNDFTNFYQPADTFPINVYPPAQVGRTYKEPFGYQIEIEYEYFIYKKLSIVSGLSLDVINGKIECSTNTEERNSINNFNQSHGFHLDSTRQNKNRRFYFEVPIRLSYSFNRLTTTLGMEIQLFEFYKVIETCLDNSVRKYHNTTWFGREFNFMHFSLNLKYKLLNKKYPVWITCAAERRWEEFIFQLGGQIRLINF